MSSRFRKLDFKELINKLLGLEEQPEEPFELFYDDQPIESILYEKDSEGPTQANLFLPFYHYFQRINNAYKIGNILQVSKDISLLETTGYLLSVRMCFNLIIIIENIVPDYPLPILKYDLSPLGSPLENMWNLAQRIENNFLQKRVGSTLYRWYEHRSQYEKARIILKRLIEISREELN